jgi:hypothetical protein
MKLPNPHSEPSTITNYMKSTSSTPSEIMFKTCKCFWVILLLLATGVTNASLMHEYSFNDAVTSTNAIDSVGGATGALYPGATYPGDGTVRLDGVSGFVYLPNDIISNYTSVAFEVWTTPVSNPVWARLFDFGTDSGGPGTNTGGLTWFYVCLDDGVSGSYRADINPGQAMTGPQPAPGESHHLVFTIDAVAKTGSLFDNGALVSFATNFTATPQGVGHTFNDYIGRSQFGDPYYNGAIDEFRIYNNAVTPVQVEADYEAGPNSTSGTSGALTSIQFNVSTNLILGGILSPNILASFANLTNTVNITTMPGITYSSANTNIVTVGSDGNFHAVGLGSTTIQASYQGQTATATVLVFAQPTVLLHRYSFDGAPGSTLITDSVGGANGTLINPSSTSTLTGSGQLTLDGNASSAYVALPAGIISVLTNASFQTWVTWYGGPVWQRIFDFGTNNGSAGVAYSCLFPNNGANGKLRYGINLGGEADVDAPTALVISNEVCVTVTYNYSAQTASIYVGGRKVGSGPMSKPLYNIPDPDIWLGHSQFSADPYFQGAYDEFRIYSGVKSDLQVAIDASTGPNTSITNPGALMSLTVATANTNVDVHGGNVPIQVLANFANVSGVDVTTFSQTTLTSGNTSVGTIVNGNFAPQNVGVSTLAATYGGQAASLAVTVVDTNAWPSLLHRYTFNDAPGSTTITDAVGTINGTLQGPCTLNGSQLVMPAGNPPPGGNGLPTTNSGWVLFPAGQGIVTSLPNEASFEIWVVWNGGGVWQEMFDFGQAATPGISLGGGQYVMICPHDGINGSLHAEWDQNPTYDVTLTGPSLQVGVLSQVVWTHDQDRQFDKLYLNGQEVSSGVNTAQWSSLPDTDNWMARDEWPDPMFNGDYSDFRIWSGALTSGQVANLYKSGPDIIAGPALSISATGGQLTLAWPANASAFSLQSTTKIVGGTWTPVPGTPTVVNGLNNLTLPASLAQTYYRLKQ